MGGRKPTTLRPRRGALKCEYCGRSVSSRQALETHQKTLHSAALRCKQSNQGSKKPITGKPKLKIVQGNAGKVVKKVLSSKAHIHKTDKKLISQRNGEHKGLKKAYIESKAKNPVGRPRKYPKTPLTKTENSTKPEKSSEEESKSKKELSIAKMDAQNSGDKLDTTLKKKKTEFKCPKCAKVFSMCFSAQKHIKKHHCVNSKGDKVNPDSSDLIQPIQVEFCEKCNIKYSGVHSCDKRAPSPDTLSLSNLGSYGCVACMKTFDRLMNFQKHVTSMHNDGLESLLFPTLQEFETWRHHMESQTKTLYVHIGTLANRQFYKCSSTQSNLNDLSEALSCPSMIIYQYYPSGIQVHFYKNHFDHECKPYCMEDMYKNYSLTDILHPLPVVTQDTTKADKQLNEDSTEIKQENESDEEHATADLEQDKGEDKKDEEDLYVKFKSMMEKIITDAAKINIASLKTLVEQAEKMQHIIKNYNEDIDLSLDNSSHDSIKTVYNSSSNNNKRKSENMSIISPLKKKLKTDTVNKSPILQSFNARKNGNSYSLADNKDDEKILKELDLKKTSSMNENTPNGSPKKMVTFPTDGSPKKMVTFPKFDCSPSAFHDSYKNFVSTIVPKVASDKNPKRKNSKPKNKQKNKSSPKFKTRIGQFNPNSPQRIINKLRDSPKRIINKHQDSPKRIINKHHDSPKVIINKHHDSPKVIINKHHDSPKVIINKHQDSPKRIIDKHHDSPKVIINKHHDSPKVIINKHQDSPKRIINKNQDSPKRIIDKRQSSPKRITRESAKSEIEKPAQIVFKAKSGPKSKRRVRDFKYEVKERANDCNILILKL